MNKSNMRDILYGIEVEKTKVIKSLIRIYWIDFITAFICYLVVVWFSSEAIRVILKGHIPQYLYILFSICFSYLLADGFLVKKFRYVIKHIEGIKE